MLDQIVASVEARLPQVIASASEFEAVARNAAPARDFIGALRHEELAVIAEIKRRSPSKGPIDLDLVPAKHATAYAEGGAAAVSVLTEPDHFSGSLDDLRDARAAVDLPMLRKDFILHPAQVWESRAAGADALLLIVAILDDRSLVRLLGTAHDAGIAALVEAHTADEADRAASAGATIVGINNRDLATFEVDLATAEVLRPRLGDVVAVAESGVSSVEGAWRMAAAGYDAILVGEAAVRSPDPAAFVASLRGTP